MAEANKSVADPLGLAAWHYFKQSDEQLEVTVYADLTEEEQIPVWYLYRSYEAMPELERLALSFCRGKVLDVGAGTGIHSLYLQSKEMEVVALDRSEYFCRIMQQRGVKNFVQTDVFQYQTDQNFDTILLLMNGIGIAGSLTKLSDFLAHLKNMLAPGGQILLESADILYMFEQEDGSYLIDLTDEYYGEMSYRMQYDGLAGPDFPWLYVSFPILEDYAKSVGLQAALCYSGENMEYLARLYI